MPDGEMKGGRGGYVVDREDVELRACARGGSLPIAYWKIDRELDFGLNCEDMFANSVGIILFLGAVVVLSDGFAANHLVTIAPRIKISDSSSRSTRTVKVWAFPVLNSPVSVNAADNPVSAFLSSVSCFFVDAFWLEKAEENELTPAQRSSLERRQNAEFLRRYRYSDGEGSNVFDGNGNPRMACSLVVAQAKGVGGEVGEVVGCAGVEVSSIDDRGGSKKSRIIERVPIMSNLAVGRSYRRKGVAVKLVKRVEELVGPRGWGYKEIYLYVENANVKALRLYRKLGYKVLWEDNTATSLTPMSNGGLASKPTTVKVMRKKLPGNFITNLFG